MHRSEYNTGGLFVILVLVLVYFVMAAHPQLETVRLEDLLPRLKTGDLILFHALDNVNSLLIGAYWTHIGVVVCIEGRPYIFEASGAERMRHPAHPTSAARRGIFLLDLEERVQRYRGYVAVKTLRQPVSPAAEAQLHEFIRHAQQHMYYDMRLLQQWLLHLVGVPCGPGTNCGELAFMSLIALGVVDPMQYWSWNPHYLLQMSNTPTHEESRYIQPPSYDTEYNHDSEVDLPAFGVGHSAILPPQGPRAQAARDCAGTLRARGA